MNPNKIHVFERAGLGRAPFRYDGFHVEVYQAIPGDPSCPIQPGTCCDYCGQGISNVCRIKDADGKMFKVGCDCVEKTGDAGLRKVVADVKRKHDRELRHARETARVATGRALLADPAVREQLAALPHPRGFVDRDTGAPMTLLDSVEWMFTNAGTAGRIRTTRQIEKLLA